ncbi:MAG: bifunctional UDP-N-acetylmuramoyl-tripeptide:D-alanyl-D-alanine ligase/alanine racemase [Chitinophagales bacterium]
MLSIAQIVAVTKAKVLQQGASETEIKYLITDSRKIVSAQDSLFFAIAGTRLDGHEYISELYAKGVRVFVVSKKVEVEPFEQAHFLQVKDVVEALQKIAAYHRLKFEYPVVGITGSNGKTIVKEWLYQLLHPNFNIVRSPKSFNSQIGVPLSLWQMSNSHNLALIEAGISEPGEMDKLEKIIKPNIGVFTNIGDAHSEGFLNKRHKTKEKLKLFMHSNVLVYCKDHAEVNAAIAEVSALNNGIKTFSWSIHSDADLKVTSVLHAKHSTFISCYYNKRNFDFEIPFSDKASVENALHCAAVMLLLEVDMDAIAERMKKLTRISMRLEMKEGINNCQIVNDSYNSDIGSLKIAVDFLNQQTQQPKHTLILSDILQSGEGEFELYEQVAKLISESKITRFIGVGTALTRQRKLFEKNPEVQTAFYANTEMFLKSFDTSLFQHEIILLKAARKFRFEVISKLLEKKAHETVLEINLNALSHNLKAYQSVLKKGTKVMCMVKAFAYGSGSYEVANVLQFSRVDYLAVAYTDEGIELRRNGITLPMMVMNPEQRSFESMMLHKLEPDLYNHRIFDTFLETLELVQSKSSEPFPVHIELETGMNRLGFNEDEIELLLHKLSTQKQLRVASIFSHLAASENPDEDAFTKQQIERFKKNAGRIVAALPYKPLLHILNSSGISRHTAAQFDMVRLGIGLYGVDENATMQKKLMPVSTLKTTISQIKHLKKGESVGYGRTEKATQDITIATVAIGYADGLSRKLGNGNYAMLVSGKLAPVIGRICMDMAMLNITDIPEAQEGDEVIVFGAALPVQQMAAAAQTIPYEIFTGISQRVKRVYFQE